MTDPKKIVAPFLRQETIREKAEEFRKKFVKSDKLPIDILQVAEFSVGLNLIPEAGLKNNSDIDAVLLSDNSGILIDQDEFLDDRKQNRIRFSIAHELGHYFLHREVYDGVNFESIDDWIKFFYDIPEDQYGWLEMHANEFAGRLLVPQEELADQYQQMIIPVMKQHRIDISTLSEDLLKYIAEPIKGVFGVSGDVIAKRLIKEGIIDQSNG